MQQFSNQEIADLKSRIDEIHELLAARGGDESAVPVRVELEPSGDVAAPRLVDQLSFSTQARRMRRHHFGSAQMSGPTWDMMLDLMLANANGRILSASDLATGAGVPGFSPTTPPAGTSPTALSGISTNWQNWPVPQA